MKSDSATTSSINSSIPAPATLQSAFRPGLSEVLACPDCKGPLDFLGNPKEAECKSCQTRFAVIPRNGRLLPILFSTKSKHIEALGQKFYVDVEDDGNFSNAKRVFKSRHKTIVAIVKALRIQHLINFIITLPWHEAHKDYATEAAVRHGFMESPTNRKILCVGSGGRVLEHMISLDIAPHENVDVVADAHALPFTDASLDAVFVAGVSEHLEKPWIAAKEIYRVLKPSGLVFWTAPFLYYNHGVPGDYFRFTPGGLRVLFEDFHELELDVYQFQFSSLLYQSKIALTFFIPNHTIRTIVGTILNYLLWPLGLLDLLMIRSKNRFTLAGCLYYVGQKPNTK